MKKDPRAGKSARGARVSGPEPGTRNHAHRQTNDRFGAERGGLGLERPQGPDIGRALVAGLRYLLVVLVSARARRGAAAACTPLLESLGAREVPRREFLRALAGLVNYPEPPMKWNMTTQRTA